MRLVPLRRFSCADLAFLTERLSPFYCVAPPQDFSEQGLCAAVAEAQVVLGERVGADIIAAAPGLRLIHAPGTHVGGIDLAAAARRDIKVCCSHSSAPLVAEHAVALLLSLMRRIALHDRAIRSGQWLRPSGQPQDAGFLPVSLRHRTVGLLGYGHIGRDIAQMVRPFGCRVLAHSRSRHGVDGDIDFVDLEALLIRSDALVVSLPLTAQTMGLLGHQQLSQLPKGAFVINVGRAAVIDESALFHALTQGGLGGAALDVWWTEPVADSRGEIRLSAAHPFHTLDNVILSPHRAAMDISGTRHLEDVVRNLIDFAKTGVPANQVDPERGY